MNRTSLGALALALVGTFSVGAAQARGGVDLQWSVTIGGGVPLPVYAPPSRGYPIYAPQSPVVVLAPQRRHWRDAGWADADRDGVPNRYDRVYNPRWDVDGDGIPNRHDRNYNPRRVEGPPQRHDVYGQPHGGYAGDAPRRGYERQPYPR